MQYSVGAKKAGGDVAVRSIMSCCVLLDCQLCTEGIADALDDVNSGAVVALLDVGEVCGCDACLRCKLVDG